MLPLKRILLAEDSIRDAELTLAALDEQDLAGEVALVRDGAEALDYLFHRGAFSDVSHQHPSVVILDLKMPRVNGLEVLRRMKSDDDLKLVPVVMLTSSREEKDLEESYRLGVNAYVVKAINFDNFLDSMQLLGTFWALINHPPPAIGHAGLPGTLTA